MKLAKPARFAAGNNTRIIRRTVTNTVIQEADAVTMERVMEVGDTVTANTENLDGPVTYQWQRDGVDIIGATLDSYVLVALDAGASIRFVAISAGTAYTSAAIVVQATATVNDPEVTDPIV